MKRAEKGAEADQIFTTRLPLELQLLILREAARENCFAAGAVCALSTAARDKLYADAGFWRELCIDVQWYWTKTEEKIYLGEAETERLIARTRQRVKEERLRVVGRQGVATHLDASLWRTRYSRFCAFISHLCFLRGSHPRNGGIYEMPPFAWHNKRLVLAAVQTCGKGLQLSSEELCNDRDVVLAAVRQDGEALAFASVALCNDREVVYAAVRQNGEALRFASDALKRDRDMVLAAVQQDGYALDYSSRALRDDRSVVLAAVQQSAGALRYASYALQSDRDVVLAAVRKGGYALAHASPALCCDRDVVLAAVRQNAAALRHASHALRNDPTVLRATEL